MTDREFFIQTAADEAPRFERVFTAMPDDKLDYKPHPGSRSAKEIGISMVGEAMTFPVFLKTGVIDFGKVTWPSFANAAEIAGGFSKAFMEAKTTAESMTEAEWASEGKMMLGEKEEWKTTRGGMAWGLFFDLIHHRGQLSTYLRPMGGKVPSIYGPSGDTKG